MTDREILGKRVRKPKQFNSKEEEEEDLKFWSKMGVVAPDKPEGEQQQGDEEDEEEEEEEDYEPEPSKQIKTSDYSSDLAEDYIDSQPQEKDSDSDYEDVSESQLPNEDQRLQLVRANLQQYGTLRSVHNYLLIDTLPRLNNSSYVHYQNKQTYKQNDFVNRIYIGLPVLGPSNDEQIKCKNEFHPLLFKMEDQRYQIDIEISQLRRCLKLPPEKMTRIPAFRNLVVPEGSSPIESIQKRIELLLELKKNHAQSNERRLEETFFKFAIDQQYYLHKAKIFSQLTSKSLQNLTIQRLQNLWNEEVPFIEQAQQYLSKWSSLCQYDEDLSQRVKDFIQKNQPIQSLPAYILHFEHFEALIETVTLLRETMSTDYQEYEVRFMFDFFDDLISALFGVGANEPKKYEFQNQELFQELKSIARLQKGNSSFESVELQFDEGNPTNINNYKKWTMNCILFTLKQRVRSIRFMGDQF